MASMLADMTNLLEGARRWWHTWYGLVLAGVAGAVIVGWITARFSVPPPARPLVCLTTLLVISLAWGLQKRLPRTGKGKVGFVISIASGSGADP